MTAGIRFFCPQSPGARAARLARQTTGAGHWAGRHQAKHHAVGVKRGYAAPLLRRGYAAPLLRRGYAATLLKLDDQRGVVGRLLLAARRGVRVAVVQAFGEVG